MQDDFDLKTLVSTKKKRKNSRKKGNTFELKIAKILNEHFNTTEFMRSPGSGAFSTTHALPEHLKFSGDLITPKSFKFVIECKKGYNKENLGSYFSETSDLMSFIDQARRDATKIGKKFLIIFQQDRKDILCIFEQTPHLEPAYFLKPHVQLVSQDSVYIICRLEDLLKESRHLGLDYVWI